MGRENNGQAVSETRRKNKRVLVERLGGRCKMCGYSRCIAALDFHHLDEGTKGFGLSRHLARSLGTLKEEVDKCVLLCANCHREVHAGFIRL